MESSRYILLHKTHTFTKQNDHCINWFSVGAIKYQDKTTQERKSLFSLQFQKDGVHLGSKDLATTRKALWEQQAGWSHCHACTERLNRDHSPSIQSQSPAPVLYFLLKALLPKYFHHLKHCHQLVTKYSNMCIYGRYFSLMPHQPYTYNRVFSCAIFIKFYYINENTPYSL